MFHVKETVSVLKELLPVLAVIREQLPIATKLSVVGGRVFFNFLFALFKAQAFRKIGKYLLWYQTYSRHKFPERFLKPMNDFSSLSRWNVQIRIHGRL